MATNKTNLTCPAVKMRKGRGEEREKGERRGRKGRGEREKGKRRGEGGRGEERGKGSVRGEDIYKRLKGKNKYKLTRGKCEKKRKCEWQEARQPALGGGGGLLREPSAAQVKATQLTSIPLNTAPYRQARHGRHTLTEQACAGTLY